MSLLTSPHSTMASARVAKARRYGSAKRDSASFQDDDESKSLDYKLEDLEILSTIGKYSRCTDIMVVPYTMLSADTHTLRERKTHIQREREIYSHRQRERAPPCPNYR